MAPLEHQALAFGDVEELVSAVAPVARRALGRGEPVVGVFPDGLADRIRDRVGPGADAIEMLAYDDCYDAAPRALARFVDTVCAYVADGRRPTLMGGSMLVDRERDDTLPWLQMESVLNDALEGADAHLLCCFPRTGANGWLADVAMSTHPSLLVDGAVVPSAGYLAPTSFLAAHPEPPAPGLGPPAAVLHVDDAAQLHLARRLVAGHGARAGLESLRAEELVMVANEAITNSLEHGAGSGSLCLWTDEHGVTCEVHDAGRFDEPHLGLLPPAPTGPRGRGLWLIRQLSDQTRLWTDETGTTVRMMVRR